MNSYKQICKHFQGKPVEYAKIVLGIELTKDQENILNLLVKKPNKVLVRSANTQGKSFLAAVAALYVFDCYDPSITIITAPTFKQVASIIFKEIRTIGVNHAKLLSPKAPLLYDHPKHQIVGNTANNATAFQGIHDATVSVIVDEMVGVDPEFIEAIEPMLGGPGYFFLGLFNPTDSASYAWIAEKSDKYHLVVLNALNHPNIQAELKGEPAPFPNAVRLDRLKEMIELWCEPVKDNKKPEDFEFDGKLWRPSPVADARILGRWPSQASNSIWSELLFDSIANNLPSEDGMIQIGCDPAAYGDDDTCIAVRKGCYVIHIESRNGWSPLQTSERLKQLSMQYRLTPNLVPPCLIDDTGLGVGVSCLGDGFNFIGINFASKSFKKQMFRNKRDEMHFVLLDKAKEGEVSFNKLNKQQLNELRKELLSPHYTLDYAGRRVVEKKEEIKKRLGKSPDLSDAVHLAFYPVFSDIFEVTVPKAKEGRTLGF